MNRSGTNNSNYKHGFGADDNKLYKVWKNMKARCNNTNSKNYENYGGRGIKVCNDWLKASSFISWALKNGYKENLQIDRKNNDLGYYPDNCRWVDLSTQALNKRIYKNSNTKMRGVGWHIPSKKYRIRICIGKKTIIIGYTEKKEEGAKMYNDYIDEHNLPNKKNITNW